MAVEDFGGVDPATGLPRAPSAMGRFLYVLDLSQRDPSRDITGASVLAPALTFLRYPVVAAARLGGSGGGSSGGGALRLLVWQSARALAAPGAQLAGEDLPAILPVGESSDAGGRVVVRQGSWWLPGEDARIR